MLDFIMNNYRKVTNATRIILFIYSFVAISMSLFHIYLAVFGTLEAWRVRSVHIFFVLFLVYLLPNGKEIKGLTPIRFKVWDIICLIVLIIVSSYCIVDYRNIILRAGLVTTLDTAMMFLLMFLILEAVRRHCGNAILFVTLFFIAYLFFGKYIPGRLGAPSFSMNKITSQMFNSASGIFGVPLSASSDFIVMFIVFGAFLVHTKAGEAFTEIAYALTGKSCGGPAKAAVVASALVGTIHGSGPGNVVTTGSFTIPMMKQIGYSPKFAAGVESAASTGGILMPPVMGSAAFLMAAITGIPYGQICIYATVPAVLYFISVFFMTHLEAQKIGLQPIPKGKIPSLKSMAIKSSPMFFALIVLVYMLFIGASASRSALCAILALIIGCLFRKKDRIDWKVILFSLEEGSKNMIPIALMCAAAGIMVGVISLTGVGVKMSALVTTVAGNSLFVALALCAIVSLILGMGMPGVAAYIIIASTIAPVIVRLGVPVMFAHLFAYYFSQMSAITPPVALSSYAAAAIAGSDLWETGWEGFKMAASGLIVPFMFIYSPGLQLVGEWYDICWALISALIGVFCLAASLIGFLGKHILSFPFRILLFLAALLMLYQGVITDCVGFVILLVCYYVGRGNNGESSKA
jgi:TRAP transporter 4TM/12TM fusion protein